MSVREGGGNAHVVGGPVPQVQSHGIIEHIDYVVQIALVRGDSGWPGKDVEIDVSNSVVVAEWRDDTRVRAQIAIRSTNRDHRVDLLLGRVVLDVVEIRCGIQLMVDV
jgi:hypothetical protein